MTIKKLKNFFNNMVFTRKKSMVSRCNQTLEECTGYMGLGDSKILVVVLTKIPIKLVLAFLATECYKYIITNPFSIFFLLLIF